MELSIFFIGSSFLAGVLMFLAPCTLPLVPGYLAFIAGVVDANQSPTSQRKIIRNAIFFVLGFSLVFVGFGVIAGYFGSLIGNFRVLLSQFGGAVIIFFGLAMAGVFSLPFFTTTKHLQIPSWVAPGSSSGAFMIGTIFALGWTPCVGPVLASVLLLATTSSTIFSGVIMLSIFSLGLAIPFLLTALLYTKVSQAITRFSYLTKYLNVIAGLFLVFVGFLLLTQNFGITVEYGYSLFYFLGLEGLFDFL